MIKDSSNTIHIDSIIWCVCYYWLLIDTITGFFLNANIQMPLSQGIKAFLLICLIIRLIKNKVIGLGISIIILYFNIIYISTSFYVYPIIQTLGHFTKLLLTILLFVFFKENIKKRSPVLFEKKAFRVFKLALIILFLNVYCGLLGIGYHTYERDQYGFKGFIYSGNEMGGLVVILIPIFLYWVYFNFSKLKYIFCSVLSVVLGILISTKSCILISFMASILIPYIYSSKKNRLKLIIISTILLITTAIFVFYNLDPSESNFIEQLYYRYDKGGLILILLSARDNFVETQFNLFNKAPLFQKLFGMGIGTNGLITVEMDYFDILFYYGYVGLFIMISMTMYLIFQVHKFRNNNSMVKLIFVFDIIMICMATLAGHIIFSSMAGLYLALFNSLIYIQTKRPLFYKLI